MPYIGQAPAPKVVTSSDLADDVVTADKIGDTAISGFDALATAPADTDEFLISDGGVLKRIDASLVGGADMVLLSTSTASSSSSISFDGFFSSTYKNYKLIVSNMIGETNNANLHIRFRRSNADVTASNYDTLMDHNDSATVGVQTGRAYGAFRANQDKGRTFTHNEGLDNTTAYSIDMVWDILAPLDTDNYKKMQMTGFARNGGSNNHVITQTAVLLDDATTALSGLSFFFSSGNIAKGNFKLYGIK